MLFSCRMLNAALISFSKVVSVVFVAFFRVAVSRLFLCFSMATVVSMVPMVVSGSSEGIFDTRLSCALISFFSPKINRYLSEHAAAKLHCVIN